MTLNDILKIIYFLCYRRHSVINSFWFFESYCPIVRLSIIFLANIFLSFLLNCQLVIAFMQVKVTSPCLELESELVYIPFFIRLLLFWPRLKILIFQPILSWKYSCKYSSINAYDISVFECIWCLSGVKPAFRHVSMIWRT